MIAGSPCSICHIRLSQGNLILNQVIVGIQATHDWIRRGSTLG
jgi:hypothetical protein